MLSEDDPNEDPSPELEGLIGAQLRRPAPKAKRTQLPARRRTAAGRRAWRIWREWWRFSQHLAPYMDWWSSLTDKERKQTVETAEKYASLHDMLDDELKGYQDLGVLDDSELLWREFTETVQLSLSDFRRLLDSDVKTRSQFAEEFGRTARKHLKIALQVPGHRPPTRLSTADRDDDLWRRRILAFLFYTR